MKNYPKVIFFDRIFCIQIQEIIMERNIIGDLLILKQMNIKPNFSELARIYDMDRHTVAKYWREGGIKKVERKPRKSILDKYSDEITRLFEKPGVHKRAAYEYLLDRYGEDNIGTYNNFKYYTWKRDMKPQKTVKPHVRYETRPGQQLQVDWKENLRMTTIHGEVIEFNLMTSTLGYSREHIFVYTKGKTTEDFLRCIIDTLYRLGGTPEHILTDNMTAVVSITNGSKRKHQKIRAFEKDNGEIENEEELIHLIEKINRRVNNTINQTTNMPPHVLFEKEKEYLRPLPNKVMLDSYVDNVITQIVPPTLLVTYNGSGYSVPTKFINKRVKLVPIENKLYVYFNTELVTVHQINKNKFNYKHDHYQEALHHTICNKDIDIDAIAEENLKLLERIGK